MSRKFDDDSGNASVMTLGLSFLLLLGILGSWTVLQAYLIHESASSAAEAAALAAAKELERAFIADITPTAYEKLEVLLNRITSDPLYKQGDVDKAIRKHTTVARLQDELLAGHRGRSVSLAALLGYRPFFNEQELGKQLGKSFQAHWQDQILPSILHYLQVHQAMGSGSVRFPVHNRIEVRASKPFVSPMFREWVGQGIPGIYGRGYVLYIKILEENGIPYDVSRLDILSKSF